MAGENFLNGINVTQLTETIEAIRKNRRSPGSSSAQPTGGRGKHNRATVKDFFGAS
jgi:hypothetical protein